MQEIEIRRLMRIRIILVGLYNTTIMIHGKKLFLLPKCNFFIDGKFVGYLKYSCFRPRATFSGREGDFVFYREKWANGGYFLTNNAATIAEAQKPNDIG